MKNLNHHIILCSTERYIRLCHFWRIAAEMEGEVGSPTSNNRHKGPESCCRCRSCVLGSALGCCWPSQNILSILFTSVGSQKILMGNRSETDITTYLPMKRLIIIQFWKTLLKLLVFVCSGVTINDMDFVLNLLPQFFCHGAGNKNQHN